MEVFLRDINDHNKLLSLSISRSSTYTQKLTLNLLVIKKKKTNQFFEWDYFLIFWKKKESQITKAYKKELPLQYAGQHSPHCLAIKTTQIRTPNSPPIFPPDKSKAWVNWIKSEQLGRKRRVDGDSVRQVNLRRRARRRWRRTRRRCSRSRPTRSRRWATCEAPPCATAAARRTRNPRRSTASSSRRTSAQAPSPPPPGADERIFRIRQQQQQEQQ